MVNVQNSRLIYETMVLNFKCLFYTTSMDYVYISVCTLAMFQILAVAYIFVPQRFDCSKIIYTTRKIFPKRDLFALRLGDLLLRNGMVYIFFFLRKPRVIVNRKQCGRTFFTYPS
jgi:hypothetical protein